MARKLSGEERAEIEREVAQVPYRAGACLAALNVIQRHRGWVSNEAVQSVAEALEMSAAEVDSVASFYNLIFRRPVGRHVIHLCDSVSCWILRAEDLRRALVDGLGIDFGETTADGRFTLLPIQCLGACDHAPALMVDEDLHQDVAPSAIDEILGRYP